MSVTINNFTPTRMRGFVPITVTGTGFSATPGQNEVLVSGISATITLESAVSITFQLPALFALGIINNVSVGVQVVNLDNNEASDTRYIWVKDSIAGVAAYGLAIPSPIPGPAENTNEERPFFYEAIDFFKLNALVEVLVKNLAVGQVLTSAGPGLRYPGGVPGLGRVLEADPAQDGGVRWAPQQDVTLEFGGQVPASNTFLVANGTQLDVAGSGSTIHAAPVAGTIDRGWVLWKGAGTLDRIRILQNGAPILDTGPGLGVPPLVGISAVLAVPVAQGDEIQIEASPLGPGGQMTGGVRLAAA